MDWDRTNEEDRQALKRIAAMLLALADLAECAGLRSRPIRILVLWILRPAEAFARDLVMRASLELGAQANLPASLVENIAPMIIGRRGDRTDALRLASAFRMLAAVLETLGALPPAPWRTTCCARIAQLQSSLQAMLRCRRKSLWREARSVAGYAYPDTS